MVETSKQVRVDNWGIFFLSRLQVFFNKTDYCDLTLQFEGNVQLKVHRLVMNACTEYFQLLEQTCDCVDDVLTMPPDLQADVILPIVNFMYTGMLEFQMSIFDRLYKTAELMNITVLLKLLDAQKQPLSQMSLSKNVVSKVPPTYNLQGKKIMPKVEKTLPATLPGRKLPVWKRKHVTLPIATSPPMTTSTFATEQRKSLNVEGLGYDNAPKPTRFEWPEEDLKNFPLLESGFENLSYTSKPLLTQEEELKASTSFDNIKALPNSNKKTQDYESGNVDMDEIKNYVKEQKIRSEIIEYEDDDADDPSDPTYTPDGKPFKRKVHPHNIIQSGHKKLKFSINEKENKEAKINIQAGRDVDHSKIISEVLRKYPHLVKNNKNIRLKIMAKSPELKPVVKPNAQKVKLQMRSVAKSPPVPPPKTSVKQSVDEGPWLCPKCLLDGEEVEFVLYYLYRKHMTDIHNEKFDSRMCKYCGHKSSKHNMLMYHQYTKHGIKPPAAYNFPKCNQCPYIALTENLLIKHKLNHTKFDLQCSECKVGFNSKDSLKQHIQITGHTGKSGKTNYDCQYCTKHYQTGASLFSHIRLQHRDEARRDGIVSIDEDDEEEIDDEPDIPEIIKVEEESKKINVLSNVNLETQTHVVTSSSNIVTHTPTTAAPRVTTNNQLTSNIATSLGFVDVVVLDENQQYILHNNQQLVTQDSQSQEFILPDLSEASHAFTQNQALAAGGTMLSSSDIASTDELVMVLTDHDYNDGNGEILSGDSSNIVVLYSHPVEGQSGQFIASQGDLMLNSETGMLELRDGTVRDPTIQAESIEMIQREIESHNIDCKSDVVAEAPVENNYINDVIEQESEVKEVVEEAVAENGVEEEKVQEVVDEPMQEVVDSCTYGTKEDDGQVCDSISNPPHDEIDQPPLELPQELEPPPAVPIDTTEVIEDVPQVEALPDLTETTAEVLQTPMEEETPAVEEMPAEVVKEPVEEIPTVEEIVDEVTAIAEMSEEVKEHAESMEVSKDIIEGIVEQAMDMETAQEVKAQATDNVDTVTESTSTGDRDDSTNDSMPMEESVTQDDETTNASVNAEGSEADSEERIKAAKISILDDWEDTDSQQSEHGKGSTTVNKLINDWDDE